MRGEGDEQRIDLDKQNFSDMLTQIECREYIYKVPSWITSLTKKRDTGNHG